MSETKESPKIPIDIIYAEAERWWQDLDDIIKESIIAEAYIQRHNISTSEIEW